MKEFISKNSWLTLVICFNWALSFVALTTTSVEMFLWFFGSSILLIHHQKNVTFPQMDEEFIDDEIK